MRFLIVTPIMDSRMGGMERFVMEFSTLLVKHGNEVTVLTGKGPGEIEVKGVKILRHKIFYPPYFNKLVKYFQLSCIARKHLRKNRYDIVLAMGYSGLFLQGFVWRTSGSPVPLLREQKAMIRMSLLSRVMVHLDLWTQESMERTCVRKAKYHMFPSVHMKSLFERAYAYKSERVFIPCSGTGTSYEKGKEAGKDDEISKTLSVEGLKILTVGGLSEQRKGGDVIIEALSGLDLSNIFLVVAGRINIKVKGPVVSRIIALGSVDFRDMPALYKNCDILIFPSISEGFPNVLLEAAYHGLPIISSRLEGIGEYFMDGRDIILVEKGDATGLSEKIKFLSGSSDMRRKLSENAKKRAESIDYDAFAREFVSFVSSKDAKEKNLLKGQA